MSKRPGSTTINFIPPNERALAPRESLIDSLERLVNLGDTLEDFHKFASLEPDFFPLELLAELPNAKRNAIIKRGWGWGLDKPPKWENECHGLFLFYRNKLRQLWKRPGPEEESRILDVLLGVGRAAEFTPPPQKFTPPQPNEADIALDEWIDAISPAGTISEEFERAWRPIRERFPQTVIELPRLIPDWKSGSFSYTPRNNFQAAVYLLFREQWRAKKCDQCSRYFIADKPAQLYHSSACYEKVKQERDRRLWRTRGSDLRRQRKLDKNRRTPPKEQGGK